MTTRPRVLALALEEPWPLNNGFRLRMFHFLSALRYHADVTLAVPRAPQHAAALPRDIRVVGMDTAEPCPTPRLPDAWTWRRARHHFGHNRRIDAWLARFANDSHFDVALLNGPGFGLHAPSVALPMVWDLVDDQALALLRATPLRQPRQWPRSLWNVFFNMCYQAAVARRVRKVLLASRVDADFARRWAGAGKAAAITNGVDFNYFRVADQPPERGVITFVGSLDFQPNTDGITRFVRDVWPRLRAAGIAHTLYVVGRRPIPAVKALAAAPGVSLQADVPDVRPFVTRAAAVIVPTRLGAGVKNKVLEACAMRRPVVATRRALGDLSARVGRDVLIAESPTEWVARLNDLHSRPELRERIADNARAWVRQAHDWDTLATKLANCLSAAARLPAPRKFHQQPLPDDPAETGALACR